MMERSCFALALVTLMGCNVMELEDLGEHACEHVDLRGTELVAASTADADDTATIEATGEPYTVALPDGTPGFVRIQLLEEADVVLFLGESGVLTSLTECDCEAPLPEPVADGFCPDEIPEHYHLHLDPGIWHLQLTSDEVDEIWLMLAPATTTTHDHEHED